MQRTELLKLTGSDQQVLGVRDYTLSGGKAAGTRAVDLYNAAGLSLTVLPDRGMDIAALSCRGVNLSFLSKTGITAPSFFTEDAAKGFFRSFYAGFLTTGGLSYMGAACLDGGEALGLHGLVSNIPAHDVCPQTVWTEGGAALCISGKVRQAQVFGEHIELRRRITMDGEACRFTIEDEVQNLDFSPAPLMLLYHMNFGYPFLAPGCELYIPSSDISPRDADAQAGLSEYDRITPPEDNFREQVFFHTIRPSKWKKTRVALLNPQKKLGVELVYDPAALPFFTQWKCMKSGEYVLGLEPGTCHVMGRAQARQDGSLSDLQPGETKRIRIEVNVFTTACELRLARKHY